MKKLYVGNLPYSITESSLIELFGSFGNVAKATIISDRATGTSKGFGFVEMSDDAEADQAIRAMNGKEIEGRALNVSEARPQEDRNRPQMGNNRYSSPYRGSRR